MKEMKRDETRKGHALIKVLGIATLAFLMLVSIAGAMAESQHPIAPFAYVSNFDDSTVSIVDISKNTVTMVPVGSHPEGIAATPDGTKVYVANIDDDSVSVISTATNKVIATIPVGNTPWGVVASPKGDKVYVTNIVDDTISVIDTMIDKVTATLDVASDPTDIAISPDGEELYVPYGNTIGEINPTPGYEGNPVSTVPLGDKTDGIIVTPNGDKIYITHSDSDTISIIDRRGNTVSTITNIDCPTGITINPDGTRLYVVGVNTGAFKRVYIINTQTDSIVTDMGMSYAGDTIAVTPDGSKICVLSGNVPGTFYTIDISNEPAWTTSEPINIGSWSHNMVVVYIPEPEPSTITVGQGATTPEITQKFIETCDRNGGLSVLGNPTTEVHSAFGFEVQDFPEMPATAGGVIMYNPNNNTAYFIHGAIWDKYYAYPDANKTRLGHIASDEKVAAVSPTGTVGKYSEFENGRIHWISDKDGENVGHLQRGESFVTYGELDELYTEMKGTYSDLGFPIADQITNAEGHDYCEFEGGKIQWSDIAKSYVYLSNSPLTIDTSYRPNPNGYQFDNFDGKILGKVPYPSLSWEMFRYTFGSNVVDNSDLARIFYDQVYSLENNGGCCFGMSTSSLVLNRENHNSWDLGNDMNAAMPSLTRIQIPNIITKIYDWTNYYQGMDKNPAVQEEANSYDDSNSVYFAIKKRMMDDNWKDNPLVIGYNWWTDAYVDQNNNGKYDIGEPFADMAKKSKIGSAGHAVVPYKIIESQDGKSAKVYVYDSNNHGKDNLYFDFNIVQNTVTPLIDESTGNFANNFHDNYNIIRISVVSLKNIEQPPAGIPSFEITSNNLDLLYTDVFGYQLGRLKQEKQEFVSNIVGAFKIRPFNGQDVTNEYADIYFIPDNMNLKREIIGLNDSVGNVNIFKKNVFISIQEQVNRDSVDTLNIPADASSVEFVSGKNTPFLNLTLEKENTGIARKVMANISQIETGGSINLSNNNGTIVVQNHGLPRTCSLHLEQVGSSPNSDDSIKNIVIEGNSIVFIKPSNWNDIANSEVVIEHDVGSDGTVDSTETIRPKDTVPPSTVMGLQSTTGNTWINWTWINPIDVNFDHTEIYLNGTFQTNISAEYFNATDLQPETDYTIGTRTVDIHGNVNETWVNLTATTRKAPIIVEAGSDQTVEEGTSVNFEGSFTASGSHTYSYHWDFGDGSMEDSSLTTSHAYADDGIYTVNLTVTDEEGDLGNDTLLVTVNNAIPVVDSGSDIIVTAGDLVSFSGTFSDPGWLDTHTAEWNFGEGTVEAGSVSEENESPNSTGTVSGNFSYFDAGEYTVFLNVTDDDGVIGQDQLTVTVLPIVATVDFDPDTLNLGSGGNWVTAYIELPDGYDVAGIDASSVLLNDAVSAVTDQKYGFVKDKSEYLKDRDGDGIPERMLKFDRKTVEGILKAGDQVKVTFAGKVEYENEIDSGKASFEGSDVIKVIEKGSKKGKTKK
ncbi:PKD domain-containing protein [Methanosarcina sp. WWM596]|uniref:PKD domain-containing protein n=1 Tax=Methanosarcina sp. WWM596 TaxID=1434103 RepID=UPI000615564A|nr:PKD domain-containing protein [Methanosarcina sp. WWM596]AKB20015.1 hypothetical protein MSWHS_3152 [Methanosarcina sp. WWM596]